MSQYGLIFTEHAPYLVLILYQSFPVNASTTLWKIWNEWHYHSDWEKNVICFSSEIYLLCWNGIHIFMKHFIFIWEWKTPHSKFGMELPFPNAMPILRVHERMKNRTKWQKYNCDRIIFWEWRIQFYIRWAIKRYILTSISSWHKKIYFDIYK